VRILLVKLGAIGDIVHALPALADARRALPDATIDWVVESKSAEILRDNPAIDHLLEIDTHSIRSLRSPDAIMAEVKRQAGSLRRGGHDVAIDLQGLLKSALVAKVSKRRWGFDRAGLKEPAAGLMYTDRVATPDRVNVIDKNRHLVHRALGSDDVSETAEFPIGTRQEHHDESNHIVDKIGQEFVVLNPAGGWVTKLWPAEKFGRLSAMIWSEMGLASVVTVGPKERELADRVLDAAGDARILVAQPTLKGLFELLKRTEIYVGGDTGPTNIAVAAGTPVVGIYGPTEWWRNGSPRLDDLEVGRHDIMCRVDCHRRTCSKWICMDISVETVFDAVASRIEKSRHREKGAAI
jgi:heptosyltransferase-1